MSVTNETDVRCPNCGARCEVVQVTTRARATDVTLACAFAHGWRAVESLNPGTHPPPDEGCLPEIVVRVTW